MSEKRRSTVDGAWAFLDQNKTGMIPLDWLVG
jgi:hypothetical protein